MPEPGRGGDWGRSAERSRRSLFFHLLVRILPVTTGAIFLSAATAYYAARGQIIRDAQEEVERRSRVSAGELESFFLQRVNDLTTLSRSPLFKDYFANREYGLAHEAEVYRSEIEKFLLDFSRRADVYPQLTFFDAEGREVVRVRDDRPERSQSRGMRALAAELRAAAAGGRTFERLEVSWHKAPVLRYGAPLYDAAGRFRGGLALDCSLSHVYYLLKRQRADSAIRSHLTDREGGGEGKTFVLTSAGGRLAASVVVQGTPWAVVSSVAQEELLDGLEIIGASTFLFCLATCLLMALVVVRLARATNRPLEELARAVRAYAQGDLDVRVEVPGQREAAVLAEAFNEMADRLKARTVDLVQRVRELTALKRMSDAVVRQLGRREIGRACLESAVTGLMFERGALYWVDHDRRVITGECVFGSEGTNYNEEFVRSHEVPFDSNDILAHVLRERRSINVTDPQNDPRCDPTIVEEAKTRAFCVAPILGRDRVLGILGVDNPSTGKPVSPAQQKSLDLFCGAAGLALENAKLLDDIVRSEDRFQTAVENSPDAVVSLDEELRVESWNRRAETVFGYRRSEMKGELLGKVLYAVDYSRMAESIRGGAPSVFYEVGGLSRDGRRLELVVTWSSQGSESGKARGWLVILRDVTEQKRLERGLVEVEKTAAAGRLISGVAHDLSNPLSSVVGYAEVLSPSFPADSEERDDFWRLRNSALRCKAVVNNLLTLVGKGRGTRVRVGLNDVVDATLGLLEPSLVVQKGITLDVRPDPEAPEIAGEFSKIQQVLVNLLVNAADALSEKKAGFRRLRVSTGRAGGKVFLAVEDDGPGVPEDMRKKIFEPFVTGKPVGKGTGLGLSISVQIVKDHGGALECARGEYGGALFTASFPPCPAGVEAAPDRMEIPLPVRGKRVLLVDDEPDQARLMSRLLKEDGLHLREATGYEDALDELKRENFDLVVTDSELGDGKGLDLLRRCRKAGLGPAFLFVTGDVLNDELYRELGAARVPLLSKPFLRSEFLRAVRVALGALRPPQKRRG